MPSGKNIPPELPRGARCRSAVKAFEHPRPASRGNAGAVIGNIELRPLHRHHAHGTAGPGGLCREGLRKNEKVGFLDYQRAHCSFRAR